MKIDDRVSNYMALLKNGTDRPALQPSVAQADLRAVAKLPPVEVILSSSAVKLADDEVRRERLNVIRQQLAEGSYNISGKDVADKILNILKG